MINRLSDSAQFRRPDDIGNRDLRAEIKAHCEAFPHPDAGEQHEPLDVEACLANFEGLVALCVPKNLDKEEKLPT